MLRGYISRVESAHTIPSLETLERFAAALGVPTYQLCDDRAANQREAAPRSVDLTERFTRQLKGYVYSFDKEDRELLLGLARRLAARIENEEARVHSFQHPKPKPGQSKP